MTVCFGEGNASALWRLARARISVARLEWVDWALCAVKLSSFEGLGDSKCGQTSIMPDPNIRCTSLPSHQIENCPSASNGPPTQLDGGCTIYVILCCRCMTGIGEFGGLGCGGINLSFSPGPTLAPKA